MRSKSDVLKNLKARRRDSQRQEGLPILSGFPTVGKKKKGKAMYMMKKEEDRLLTVMWKKGDRRKIEKGYKQTEEGKSSPSLIIHKQPGEEGYVRGETMGGGGLNMGGGSKTNKETFGSSNGGKGKVYP